MPVLTICSDNLKRNASTDTKAGAQTAVTVEQEHATRPPCWLEAANALLGWSAPQPGAPRQSRRSRGPAAAGQTPQHKAQCAGPAVQVDAKAASKTAASGHEGPNVPLATPPRRPLAPPPNGPCSSATLAAETALVAAKATATAVAARLNVGSAASPQPSRTRSSPAGT